MFSRDALDSFMDKGERSDHRKKKKKKEKERKLRYQIDAQKYKISAMLSLTKKLVWPVCVFFQ